ncbi:MAG TPA: helix-turn-helix domain-containing protein [Burkholderiaceae bacterium]|nr:helix-turn-helix domain-containing protein [Burkholderiaceae bacterium]
MAQQKLSRELAAQAVAAVDAQGGNVTRAAGALGISRGTLENRLRSAAAHYKLAPRGAAPQAMKFPPAPPAPPVIGDRLSEADELKNRVFELEAQLKSVRSNTLTDEYVQRKIIQLNADVSNAAPPGWVFDIERGLSLPGVPHALWSDWHWGEVVFPAQVNGVNEFNLEIAHRRARSLVEKTIVLLRHHIVNPDYPGLVLALGGDMLTGDIHDELTESNEQPNMVSLLDLFEVLVTAIRAMADEFGLLFVPCVAGNHGRNTKKPRAKNRAFSNFDWLLYQFLAKAFEGDERIKFFIPDGPDALYTVAGHKYLLTHGDQFRGGDGMIGHFGPVLRGQKKKQSRNADIGLEFDTMIHGHFHTYFPTDKIIGNGSLKGLDEYAFQGNFSYEPPIQALWITHPEHGITHHLPVYLERHAGKVDHVGADWVTWNNR